MCSKLSEALINYYWRRVSVKWYCVALLLLWRQWPRQTQTVLTVGIDVCEIVIVGGYWWWLTTDGNVCVLLCVWCHWRCVVLKITESWYCDLLVLSLLLWQAKSVLCVLLLVLLCDYYYYWLVIDYCDVVYYCYYWLCVCVCVCVCKWCVKIGIGKYYYY